MSHLLLVPRNTQYTVAGKGYGSGYFVINIKPMESPMGHLKIIYSQQANPFGKHLKGRCKHNRKAKG